MADGSGFLQEPKIDKRLTDFTGRAPTSVLDAIPKKEMQTIGERRIRLEGKAAGLKDKDIDSYVKLYKELVSDIAGIIRPELKPEDDARARWLGPPQNQETFLDLMGTIMNSNLELGITPGSNSTEFLHESLRTNKWDCDNGSFLVFDVGRALGIKEISLVFIPGTAKNRIPLLGIENTPLDNSAIEQLQSHCIVTTESCFFESTSGWWLNIENLRNTYPIILFKTSDDREIEWIDYHNIGIYHKARGEYGKAIAFLNEAIQRVQGKSTISQLSRGRAYAELKSYENAAVDFATSIMQVPNLGTNVIDLRRLYELDLSPSTKDPKTKERLRVIRGIRDVRKESSDGIDRILTVLSTWLRDQTWNMKNPLQAAIARTKVLDPVIKAELSSAIEDFKQRKTELERKSARAD